MNYYATVGYGICLSVNALPEFFKRFDSIYEGDDFSEWFDEERPWNVYVDHLFDASDGGYLLFYLEGTHDSGEARQESGIAQLADPDKEGVESLYWVANTIGVKYDLIGWYHIWTAS